MSQEGGRSAKCVIPCLGDVHGHGGSGGDQTTDHAGNEMEEQAVMEVTCTEA